MNDTLSPIASLNSYSKLTREKLALDEAPIISYFGLWLLLARYSNDHRWPDARKRLEEILNGNLEELQQIATTLINEPHGAVKAAAEAWAKAPVNHLTTEVKPMPTQEELDRWAYDHTEGYIPKFPLTLDPLVAMLMATAVVGKTSWQDRLPTVDGKLFLRSGKAIFTGVISTEAAGKVAVVIPKDKNGISVASFIADPSITPSKLWGAVDEILAKPLVSEPILEDGHAWRVESKTMRLSTPVNPVELHQAFLPAWKAKAEHELTEAPGVSDFIGDFESVECLQSAMGEYTDEGFVGAAVTAMAFRASGMFSSHEHELREVTFDFNRPHALTAVVRDEGPWGGLRIFDAWVTL